MKKKYLTGIKFDTDKPRWDLLPWDEIEDIVKVITYGAKKYDENNWQKLDNLEQRYEAALLRHLQAYRKNRNLSPNKIAIDPESGLPHLAHAAASLLFLMWGEKNRVKNIKRKEEK